MGVTFDGTICDDPFLQMTRIREASSDGTTDVTTYTTLEKVREEDYIKLTKTHDNKTDTDTNKFITLCQPLAFESPDGAVKMVQGIEYIDDDIDRMTNLQTKIGDKLFMQVSRATKKPDQNTDTIDIYTPLYFHRATTQTQGCISQDALGSLTFSNGSVNNSIEINKQSVVNIDHDLTMQDTAFGGRKANSHEIKMSSADGLHSVSIAYEYNPLETKSIFTIIGGTFPLFRAEIPDDEHQFPTVYINGNNPVTYVPMPP
jgi:hypothetical protein